MTKNVKCKNNTNTAGPKKKQELHLDLTKLIIE